MAESDSRAVAAALVAKEVWKSYRPEGGELPVLQGLDLTVEKGEIVGIVGVSGVGKSTLLHVLGALDKPDRGEVLIGGVPVAGLSPEDLAAVRNRGVGFVFQFHYLLPEFTALENVMMPLLIRREPPAKARERARGLLTELGLEHRLSHPPSRLSGGEQQRVAIARALCTEPSVLLADEPTGNLDPHTGATVFERLRTLAKLHGMACVVATHNETLAGACDRIVQLCEGTLREVTFRSGGAVNRDRPVPGPSA
jgi:lipoprotein-releasing system ATP-binding protein